MPCYDPPYETSHPAPNWAEVRLEKYVQQLKDIEALCQQHIPADSMSTMSAATLAEQVIALIHQPWETS